MPAWCQWLHLFLATVYSCGGYVLFLRQHLFCCCWHNLNISPPYYFKYRRPLCKGSFILECNHLSLSLEINSIKAWTGKQDEELSFCYLLKLQSNIFFPLFLLIASHHPVTICVVSTEWGPWVNINALLAHLFLPFSTENILWISFFSPLHVSVFRLDCVSRLAVL